MMGKLREENYISFVIMSILVTFEHGTCYISFNQLGIKLVSKLIHIHESCHSFESFKRMYCPLSYCVFVWFSHATKSFVVFPDVQREVEEVSPLQSK